MKVMPRFEDNKTHGMSRMLLAEHVSDEEVLSKIENTGKINNNELISDISRTQNKNRRLGESNTNMTY